MRRALFLAALLLAGCANLTPEAQLWTACRSFVDTQKALQPFAPQMSVEQARAVLAAERVARPICTGGSGESPDLRSALSLVRAKLAELVRIQNEVKGAN